MRFAYYHTLFMVAMFLAMPAYAMAAPVRILVSLPVLQEPVARLASGWGDVALIAPDAKLDHGHHASWPPSAMVRLRQADAVIWVGAEMEESLAPHMAALPATIPQFALSGLTEVAWQPLRHGKGAVDRHFWLDPARMDEAMGGLARALAARFPEHAGSIAQQRILLGKELAGMRQEWQAKASHWRGRALLAQHDGWGYLEGWLGIRIVAVLESHGHDAGFSASHMQKVRDVIRAYHPACLLVARGMEHGSGAEWAASQGVPPVAVDAVGALGQPYAKQLLHIFNVLEECF